MLSGYGGGSGADREGRRGPEVESDDVSGDAAFDELPEDGAVSGASARGGIRKCARGGVLGSGTARRTCRADHDRDNASPEVGDAHARAPLAPTPASRAMPRGLSVVAPMGVTSSSWEAVAFTAP